MEHEKRFAELDGLRGLTALTVVTEHLSNAHMSIAPGYFLGGQSRMAVWVFFVLSAFLLTTQAISATPSDRAGWTLRYFIRRTFRIYPLFLFCIAIDLISQRMTFEHAIDYVTLQSPCCMGIYWTIPPEFKFYFLIPLIGVAAARFPRSSLAALLLFTVHAMTDAAYYTTFGFMSTFCFGSIAAILLLNWPKLADTISKAWFLAPVAMLLSGAPLVKALGLDIIPWEWNGFHGALWALVILACARGERLLSWLACRPLRYMGAISFSVYLTHPWIIAIAKHIGLGSHFWAGSVLFVAIVAFGTLIFRTVEKGGVWAGRRIEKLLPTNADRTITDQRAVTFAP